MLLTLLLGLVNGMVAFFGRRIPGLDLTPFFIIILARARENLFFGALVLVLALHLRSFRQVRYVWLVLPATLLIGFFATLLPASFSTTLLLLLCYHAVCFLTALLFRFAGPRYLFFVFVNVSFNLIVARLFFLF